MELTMMTRGASCPRLIYTREGHRLWIPGRTRFHSALIEKEGFVCVSPSNALRSSISNHNYILYLSESVKPAS